MCGHVVVIGLYVRLSWYTMWMRGLLFLLDVLCVCCEGVKVTAMLMWVTVEVWLG